MAINGITICSLSIITLLLIFIIINMCSQPRQIDKYVKTITKIREKLKTENFGPEERKKMKHKEEKYYLKLSNAIKNNLYRIVKRNKCIAGTWAEQDEPIIADNEERQAGLERLKVATMGTTSEEEGTHTINKFNVYLCDENHPDDNTLAHVIIHEYAHVINSTIGHDEKWQRLFDILQDIATKEGWFKRHKKLELATYCGGKYN